MRAPRYLVINILSHENQAFPVLRHGLTLQPSLTLNKMAQEIFLLQNANLFTGATILATINVFSFLFFCFYGLRGDLM